METIFNVVIWIIKAIFNACIYLLQLFWDACWEFGVTQALLVFVGVCVFWLFVLGWEAGRTS